MNSLSSESQQNDVSNNILSVRKECQLFTHESNAFLGEQYVIPPIQTNGTECSQTHRHTKVKTVYPWRIAYSKPNLSSAVFFSGRLWRQRRSLKLPQQQFPLYWRLICVCDEWWIYFVVIVYAVSFKSEKLLISNHDKLRRWGSVLLYKIGASVILNTCGI